VQQRVTKAMSEMTGVDLSRSPRGIDGCGIPVLACIARQPWLAKMRPRKLSADRADAANASSGDHWPGRPCSVDRTLRLDLDGDAQGAFVLKGVRRRLCRICRAGLAWRSGDDGAGAREAACATLRR